MKDTKRIPIIMKAVQELWENNPDLRFGQLVNLISVADTGEAKALFYMEDDVLAKKLKKITVELAEYDNRKATALTSSESHRRSL